MHSMCEDRSWGQQPILIIHTGVGVLLREEQAHSTDLGRILRDMGLDVQRSAIPRCVSGGLVRDGTHGGGGTGQGEARGQDGLDERAGRVDAADVGDDGFVVGQGGRGRGVAVVFWAGGGIVHTDAADEGFLAALEAEACEDLRGGDVDGCVVRGVGGAVREGAGDGLVVDAEGVSWE